MKVFDKVPIKVPAKNVFNLSHDVKASYNFGKLYPFLCQPVYPGDTWNCRAEVFMRTMPLVCPVMHNVDMHFYFFFVPNRIIWNENRKQDWKVFITGGEDGLQNPVLPYWTYSQIRGTAALYKNGSLIDHLGFPSSIGAPHSSKNDKISALPLRAYQCVWNEYFRNQNVQNEIEFSYGAGQISSTDVTNLFNFRYKNFEKDYFTSCLPFAQRGEAVRLPVTFDAEQTTNVSAPVVINTGKSGSGSTEYGIVANAASANSRTALAIAQSSVSAGAAIELHGTATINSSTFTFAGVNAGTINDFRYCLRLQQWLENNARCGSRYIEQLLSHFGVVSSDARLQRPELLGGGKVPLIFNDVPQTSFGQEAVADDVLGNLAGKGTLYGKTGGFKKYFEEHGILLGICCILPRTSYQQGLPRVWSAMSRYDFYFPEFAHLGEEAVLNKEVYYNPTAAPAIGDNASDAVFGYQGRFTELRYIPSTVHGELRSTLQYWHFGRIFDGQPALNSEFVTVDTRTNMWALTENKDDGGDPFIAQIHLDIKAVRPLPKYAVPTL